MNKKPRNPARTVTAGAGVGTRKLRQAPKQAALARVQALTDFDPEAWTALLAEQRIRIAMAAGVDPSKVKIHFGH